VVHRTAARRASWVLLPDSSSVPAARHLVQQKLAEWGCDGTGGDAELLVTEVVTNAVRHGWGKPILTLVVQNGTMHLKVEDENPAPPRICPPDEGDIESGRGLLLVDALSSAWGTKDTYRGKVVWFELPIHPVGEASCHVDAA
jgi:anti-sigma regulatory factor (Ser/Thr protein kinase)